MSKREAIRERRRKQKQQQRLVTIMVIAGFALIAVALIMLPALQRNLATVGDFTQPELNPRPMADGNAMGDPNAPVQIIEYSDLGCSHCADFAQSSGELIATDYVATGQVHFVSRSVGNLLNNANTQLAAEAAYCAADQNKYWEYTDIVFANQSLLFYGGINAIDNYLKAFAESLNLDMKQFDNCFDNHQFRQQVLTDGSDARAAGVNSTPSFLINGVLVVGNLPYEQLQAYITQSGN
ncbi:MAG TPA: hypothetical protein DEH25_03640 [Chloroflexi bacterium]|nr:hypothetical protein [Chloroflexota bacterium]